MSYTFNKKLVEQLRNGEICAYFNREKDSLEMLQALCKEAFKEDAPPTGKLKFYWANSFYSEKWVHSDTLPKDKTPIPLSNFVQPEQSERDVMAGFDERLKRLEDILLRDNEPCKSEPELKWTPKVGEWFKVEFGGLYYCTISDENGVFGDNQNGDVIGRSYTQFTKPTDKEVEDYMVGLAKEKGYKVGVQIKTIVDWHEPMIVEIDSHNNAGFHFSLNLLKNGLTLNGFAIWYPDTGWAEIVNPVRWRADSGKKYHSVLVIKGEFMAIEHIEKNTSWDNNYYNSGNYFQTTQQAEEMAVLMQFTLNNPELVKQLMDKKE